MLVGDQDDGSTRQRATRRAAKHVGGRGRVEVAGGLVGQDEGRLADERAGYRDALLLPSGQLAGSVVDPVGQSHPLQREQSACLALLATDAGVDQRQLHVAPGRHGRQEVELLEDEADPPIADLGQLGLVHRADVLAGQQ